MNCVFHYRQHLVMCQRNNKASLKMGVTENTLEYFYFMIAITTNNVQKNNRQIRSINVS